MSPTTWFRGKKMNMLDMAAWVEGYGKRCGIGRERSVHVFMRRQRCEVCR